MILEEFVVNKFITLKLEDGETNIYINGDLFRVCKALMLNIPIDETKSFEDIKSIEEALEKLKSTEKNDWENIKYELSPEEEFFGHCSNIQMWVENNFNSCLLHYSLSFSLLQELSKYDQKAKTVLKEEIAIRFGSGNEKVTEYLYESRLIYLLSHDDFIDTLLDQKEAEILRELESIIKELVYIVDNDIMPPNYTQNSNLLYVENKHVIGLRLGKLNLKIIPDVVCEFKHLTDIYFHDLSIIKFIPEFIKHLHFWQDSDFVWSG